jgi:hypothetical protein
VNGASRDLGSPCHPASTPGLLPRRGKPRERGWKTTEPNKQDVTLTNTDMDAPAAKTSYYNVRIEQADANLAWASPLWITCRAK